MTIQLINSKKEAIFDLCQKFNVEKLFVFGSIVRGDFRNDSDIDFLVFFKSELPVIDYADNFFDFIYALEKLLDRKVDMVSGKAMKNPYFIEEVEKTKQIVYDIHNPKIAV